MNREVYKDVRGYEGLYKVSNKGNVIAVARECIYTRNDKTCSRDLPERLLIPQVEACDYLHVTLTKEGKGKIFKLHRLVAENFLPDWDPKLTVDHIDRQQEQQRGGKSSHVDPPGELSLQA